MQQLKRLKTYKNVSPAETVKRIRDILFDNDIFVIEVSQKIESVTGVCSCRVILGDEGLRELNIGTNGKGMNARYALASAYAEFMERFQNGALLWKVSGVPDTIPGAVMVNQEEFREITASMMNSFYGEYNNLEDIINQYVTKNSCYMKIELKDFQSSETLALPVGLFNKMTGSNGMAAGNTRLEAIIQGLSEIFERVAIHTLFWNRITPPSIPIEYFTGTDVYKRLERLSTRGISYTVFDCSIGKGLPVIGLLIEKGNRYHVHFGADPSPITALERCLTEIFQGRNIDQLPLYPLLSEDAKSIELFLNEEKQYTDSTGQVPAWMVNNISNDTFKGFKHPITVSDEDDMAYYMDILNNLGKKLYVYDCDILGFPAVRLYVPGLTENHCPTPETCLTNIIPADIKAGLCRLPLLSDEEFSMLAKAIHNWISSVYHIQSAKDALSENFAKLKFAFPAGNFPGRFWDDSLIIAAIYIRGGVIDQGMEWFNLYVEKHKFNVQQIEVLKTKLKSKSLVFLASEWPQCPNCSICRAAQLCHANDVKQFINKNSMIYEKQKS